MVEWSMVQYGKLHLGIAPSGKWYLGIPPRNATQEWREKSGLEKDSWDSKRVSHMWGATSYFPYTTVHPGAWMVVFGYRLGIVLSTLSAVHLKRDIFRNCTAHMESLNCAAWESEGVLKRARRSLGIVLERSWGLHITHPLHYQLISEVRYLELQRVQQICKVNHEILRTVIIN